MIWNKKAMVAEILVIVVILASMGMLLMTFQDDQDTTNISRAVLDAIINLRDRIAQGILEWLAGGISDDPLACNGLYPLSDDISLMEDEIFAAILPYLPDGVVTDGVVTIDLGLLTGVEFDGEGLQIIIEEGGVIYDDGAIYAEDELSQNLNFALRVPFFLDRVENWSMCDHGFLGERMSDLLGAECFFGKRKIDCGEIEKHKIGQKDMDFLIDKGPTPAKVAKAVMYSIDELNAYFNGTGACGGTPLEDSGIRCRFEMSNLGIINDIYPYSSGLSLDPEEIGEPKYELNRFLAGFVDRVNILPATREIAHYQDSELDCSPDSRVYIPSGVTYADVVNPLMEDDAQDLISGDFDIRAYPTMFVNTTRGAKFDLLVTCNDPAISLLGNPVEYSFMFRYGIKQHCGPPDALLDTRDEPVCRPCGIPPQVDLGDCVSLPCGPKVLLCKKSFNWLRVYGNAFYNDLDLYDFLQEIYDTEPKPQTWNTYLSDECNVDLDDLENCYGGVKSHNSICCILPGYIPPDDDRDGQAGQDDSCTTSLDPTNPNCFMDIADYIGLCTGLSDCGKETSWRLGDLCVTSECIPDPVRGEVCIEGDPEDALDDGSSCSGGGESCYWCSDGTGGQEAGRCLFNPTKEGFVCNDAYPCQTQTCQEFPPSFGPGCYRDRSLDAGTDVNCLSVYRGSGLDKCMDAFCDGTGGCDRIYDPALTDTRCSSGSASYPCPPPDTGRYSCSWDVLCEPNDSPLEGGCTNSDTGDANCAECELGGGGCMPDNPDGC